MNIMNMKVVMTCDEFMDYRKNNMLKCGLIITDEYLKMSHDFFIKTAKGHNFIVLNILIKR